MRPVSIREISEGSVTSTSSTHQGRPHRTLAHVPHLIGFSRSDPLEFENRTSKFRQRMKSSETFKLFDLREHGGEGGGRWRRRKVGNLLESHFTRTSFQNRRERCLIPNPNNTLNVTSLEEKHSMAINHTRETLFWRHRIIAFSRPRSQRYVFF